MNRELAVRLVGCLILASLLASCARATPEVIEREIPVEVVKEVPVEVVKEVPVEVVVEKEVPVEVVVEKEVPVEVVKEAQMSLSALAQSIRTGDIDVGTEYGMAPDQRFHRIHGSMIGIQCTQCHVKEAPLEVALPPTGIDPVDRRICLGCHLTGPAQNLYVRQE